MRWDVGCCRSGRQASSQLLQYCLITDKLKKAVFQLHPVGSAATTFVEQSLFVNAAVKSSANVAVSALAPRALEHSVVGYSCKVVNSSAVPPTAPSVADTAEGYRFVVTIVRP